MPDEYILTTGVTIRPHDVTLCVVSIVVRPSTECLLTFSADVCRATTHVHTLARTWHEQHADKRIARAHDDAMLRKRFDNLQPARHSA